MMNVKKIAFITTSLLGLLFTSQIFAKQKEKIPDFSGHWGFVELLCERDLYMAENYVFKQKGHKVWGTYNGGASAGKGYDEGKVRGVIKGNRLFIQECSTPDEYRTLIDVCPKYSHIYYFFVKKNNNTLKRYFIYKKYNNDYSQLERKGKPDMFYRDRKNKPASVKKIGGC